jgi:hypothetical protein
MRNIKMVTAIIVVEMMGKPADYLKQSLETHIGNLEKRKNVEIKRKDLNDPKEIENSGGMFSCFAEVELEVEKLKELFDIIFDYMPSSVEVVEPSSVSISLEEATALLNNLTGRLHRYDEVAKSAKFRMDHLMKQVQIATKVLEDNGLAKDGKLVPSVAKKFVAGDNTKEKKAVKKTVKKIKKKTGKKKK